MLYTNTSQYIVQVVCDGQDTLVDVNCHTVNVPLMMTVIGGFSEKYRSSLEEQ